MPESIVAEPDPDADRRSAVLVDPDGIKVELHEVERSHEEAVDRGVAAD